MTASQSPKRPPKSPAQRQRDYRRRHVGGQLSVIIDPGAKACLEQIAKTRGWTLRRTIERMIFETLQSTFQASTKPSAVTTPTPTSPRA